MYFKKRSYWLVVAILFVSIKSLAQNPIIYNQFTADPSARVFNDKVYLYPSHDILAEKGRGRVGWFCMEDYHCFSSTDLVNWTDNGIILSQKMVSWVDTSSYSMWAPDCVFHNGKYYFYFPARLKDTSKGPGFGIGVASSIHPAGPFSIEPEPIKNVKGIDPNVFIDKDQHVYLYWASGNIYVARLKENMTELDTEPKVLQSLPEKGLKEGPFVFERKGIYYLTYPHVQNKIERLEYAIGDNPLGPFTFAGVIMDESPTGCWTNHHSIVKFREQWYLFYHSNDLSPHFDKNRSVRIDSLFFNENGTIRKVTPTLRGVGLSEASSRIQLDRYSDISKTGVSIMLLDSNQKQGGWLARLSAKNAWLQYNSVDFGINPFSGIELHVSAKESSVLEFRIDGAKGDIIAKANIPKGYVWKDIRFPLLSYKAGVHSIWMSLTTASDIEVDYIRFIK